MGTKVIDKLRIQGKSAPRVMLEPSTNGRSTVFKGHVSEGSSPAIFGSSILHADPLTNRAGPRTHPNPPTLVLIPEPGQEVKSKHTRPLGSGIPSSSSSSAASRRLEYLQRVQQANRGLSTADGDIHHRNNSPLTYSRQHIGDSISSVARVNCAYTNTLNATLPNIQFLLRGKPVHQELEIGPYKVSSAPSMKSEFHINSSYHQGSNSVPAFVPHQRVGHYKTSAKEVYRARHKHDIVHSLLLDPRHASSAYHAVRTRDVDVSSNANTVLGNSTAAASAPAYFYLGPPMSAPNQTKSPVSMLNRPKLYIPTASTQINSSDAVGIRQEEGGVQQRASINTENFSLTGQQFMTPRLVNIKTGDEADLHEYQRHLEGLVDYSDNLSRSLPFLMPEIHNRQSGSPPLVNGSRNRKFGGAISTRSRDSNGAPPVPPSSSAAGIDLELLQQCLHVNQPQPQVESGSGGGVSSSEAVRLKHLTQYVKKDDSNSSVSNSVIPNKAARSNYNTRGNEKRAIYSVSKPSRYVFDSVNSYIHFNKIYPKLDGNTNDGTATTTGTNRPHIPQVDGFSPHCTETVMLKMMFGMNKPAASVKSGARYSDIAVHADLDEFVVVGSTTTTSASRSTSVASRKFQHNTTNNQTIENGNDSGSNRRQSNTTMRRNRSNLSSSMDFSVDLRERKAEEEDDENDDDPTWPIPEVECDKTQGVSANDDFVVGGVHNDNGVDGKDANITVIAIEENSQPEDNNQL